MTVSKDEFDVSDEEDFLLAVEEVEELISSQGVGGSSQLHHDGSQSNLYQSSLPIKRSQSVQSSQTIQGSQSSQSSQTFQGSQSFQSMLDTQSSQPYQSTLPSSRSKPTPRRPLGEITPNPMMTPRPSSQVSSTSKPKEKESEYRLTFGKHVNKTLAEIPRDYIRWLEQQSWIADPGLKRSLEDLKKTEALQGSQKQKNEAPKKQKNESPKEQKNKGPYVFDFSTHKGKTLDQVPPSFIDYLHANPEIVEKRPDLEAALKVFNKNKTAAQIAEARSSNWEMPASITTDHRRYYMHGKQMWIAESDTLRFFGVVPGALRAAGVSYCRTRPRAFWVHQVFSFAKHFETTKPDTPTKALSKFKAKNYSV